MEVQYRDTLPDDVRSAFDKAIKTFPQKHLYALVIGDEINGPEEALCWFQDFAFTQSFAVVISSRLYDRF